MKIIALLGLLATLVSGNTFWITTELVKVDWREGCLTTANCAQPRFKILEELLTISDERTVSWPISEHFVQDAPRVLVSEWRSGKPEDVSLSCQVVGTDIMYGFPRTCDKTASVRVFQVPEFEPMTSRSRRHQMNSIGGIPEEKGKSLIEIRGKCFNATLMIEKHTERCPTCPDPEDLTIIGQEIPDESSAFSASILAPLRGEDRLMHIGMLALAAIAVSTSAAFGCLLVAFMRQKKTSRQISVKPRYHLPYSPALVKADDESRYDMPWEHHRNLGYWQTKSDTATTTSPLDSSSSIGTGRYNYRSTIPPPQTRIYHHISPNSSIGAHDSGLESV